jgi:hypothetical protein
MYVGLMFLRKVNPDAALAVFVKLLFQSFDKYEPVDDELKNCMVLRNYAKKMANRPGSSD